MTYMFDVLASAEEGTFNLATLDERPFVKNAVNKAARAPIVKPPLAEQAERYSPSDGLRAAANAAIALGRPLLLTGAPGMGKTQAAYWIAKILHLGDVLEFQVKADSTSADLIYQFEAVRYMATSMRAQPDAPLPPRDTFLLRGPLWEAFESDRPRVLLIDEIDKAPRDFPNDLLREIDQWTIEVTEAREGQRAGRRITCPPQRRPIVVVTSNGERPLPDPFMRRCLFYHVELSEEKIREILTARRKAGDFAVNDALIVAVTQERERWRKLGHIERLPGVSELLDWLVLADVQDLRTEEVYRKIEVEHSIPNLFVLLKTEDDQRRAIRE